jgi:DNA-directed RNA polymerase specialized sigma24 family protein
VTVGRVDVPTLYQMHWRYLVRLAVLLVDDVASAEDVVQDAFVALPTPRWRTCGRRY